MPEDKPGVYDICLAIDKILNNLDKPMPLLLNGSMHEQQWLSKDVLTFTTFLSSWQDKIDGKIAGIVYEVVRVLPVIRMFRLLKNIRCGIFCGEYSISNSVAFLKNADKLTDPGNVFSNICNHCPHETECKCDDKFFECGNDECVMINCIYSNCIRDD